MRHYLAPCLLAAAFVLSACDSETAPSDQHNTTAPEGVIAWYKLDQNVADSSGNNHHGVEQGGRYTPDRFGSAQSALLLDSQSFFSVAHSEALNFDSLDSYSITAWVKTSLPSSNNYTGIVAKGPITGSLPGYAVGIKNGYVNVQFSSADNVELQGKTVRVNDNKWHFITVTVGTEGGIFLYVDGQLDEKTISIGMFPHRNNQAPLFIGKDRLSNTFYKGVLDDIRFYDRALTASEIDVLFTEGGWNGGRPDTTSTGEFVTKPLDNPGFATPLTSSARLDANNCEPWDVAYGLPWIGAGFGADGVTRGYLYMWGTSNDGCAVFQSLSTPIQQGRTYRIRCKIRFDHENTTPYIRVRFLAFNQFGSGIPWNTVPGARASLGSITVSTVGSWDQYVTTDWVADADYSMLEIDCQNDNAGQGAESWAKIDDVEIQEKQ